MFCSRWRKKKSCYPVNETGTTPAFIPPSTRQPTHRITIHDIQLRSPHFNKDFGQQKNEDSEKVDAIKEQKKEENDKDVAKRLEPDSCDDTEDEADRDSRVENVELRRLTDEGLEVNRRGGFRGQTVDFSQEIVKYKKSIEDEEVIKNAIKNNSFLCNVLQDEQLQDIVEAMYPKEVNPGEVIIKQGDDGDHMFVSSTGRYEIIINEQLFDTFNDCRIFGELAILYNNPRLATITAVTKGKVWILDRKVYQQVLVKNAISAELELLSFLKNVPEIKNASEQKLKQIVNLFLKNFFKTDTVIIQQGDKGDKFYIIKAGTVTVTVEGKGVVASLGRGQFFGERALLQEDCRQATVTADSPGVECLILSRTHFIKYLGDLSTFIAKEEEELDYKIVENEFSHIKLDELTRVATLGIGGFGRVELVQHKTNSKQVFALKYLKKVNMTEEKQHAFNEKNILMSCNSDFIVRLYKTYQDPKYLYYLMESCLGGDLWGLLQRQKTRCFDEPKAKFLAACVIEAIDHLHQRNYVYRDLKPENMLIDQYGYLKLTDFGFAKRLGNGEKTYTFAGTPEYVPPEIIYCRGHDKSVDYWALGVFIFELLVGRTPFKTKGQDFTKTYSLILKGIENVMFPSRIPKHAQQIVRKLCKSIATERLGCQRKGIEDIRNHKWFADFDWQKLRERKISAVPFIPVLKGPVDTSYFDTFPEDTDEPAAILDDEMWEGF